MTLIYIFLLLILLGVVFILWINIKRKEPGEDRILADIKYRIDSFNNEVARVEAAVKNEMVINRQESNGAAKNTREELSASFRQFSELISTIINDTNTLQKTQLETFSVNLNNLTQSVEQKLAALTGSIENKLKEANETGTTNSKKTYRNLKY